MLDNPFGLGKDLTCIWAFHPSDSKWPCRRFARFMQSTSRTLHDMQRRHYFGFPSLYPIPRGNIRDNLKRTQKTMHRPWNWTFVWPPFKKNTPVTNGHGDTCYWRVPSQCWIRLHSLERTWKWKVARLEDHVPLQTRGAIDFHVFPCTIFWILSHMCWSNTARSVQAFPEILCDDAEADIMRTIGTGLKAGRPWWWEVWWRFRFVTIQLRHVHHCTLYSDSSILSQKVEKKQNCDARLLLFCSEFWGGCVLNLQHII